MSRVQIDIGPKADGQKVMLATTAYDAPASSYTFAIQASRQALEAAGIQTAYLLLAGNCHVDDARNSVVQEFLLTDCTDLVFLDADVSWQPEDLVKLCRFDCDLVGGVYPYRRQDLKRQGGMPVRAMYGENEPDEDGLLEVDGLPTGFMRIRRHVIETLVKACRHFKNKNDARSDIPLLFERVLERGTRWGGDLNFCNKWKRTGGKIHAACDIRLGHEAKMVLVDSLGAALRRQKGTTLRYVADQIRAGSDDTGLYNEAIEFVDNPFAAAADVLAMCVLLAREADGPILETGSGLTSVLMAAANPDQRVWCLEHSPHFAAQLRVLAESAGVANIALVEAPLVAGWYDLADDLEAMPQHFALALNDGPPRQLGDRMKFYEMFGARCDLIVADDAGELDYKAGITEWAERQGRDITFPDVRSALILRPQMEKVA